MKALEKFLRSEGNGAFYIGHASALVRLNKRLILFDPIWGDHKPYGKYWTFYPAQYDCSEVVDIADACIVSHIHEDHVCDPILKQLRCFVTIMGARINLAQRISRSREVQIVPRHQWHNMGGFEAYFIPHAFNSIDSSCVVRDGKTTVYVGSDNFLDDKLLDRIAPDVGQIDIAFVPYAFIHWYPHLLKNITIDERLAEIKRLNQQSLEQAYRFVEKLKPKVVVPFGANLMYAESLDHPLNHYLVKPEEFHGATVLNSGDWIDKNLKAHKSVKKFKFKATKMKPMNFNVRASEIGLHTLSKKLQQANYTVPNNVILVNEKIVIDLETKTCRVGGPQYDKNLTMFNFDVEVFSDWMQGRITFEQAIGTRRFECHRIPNVYNLQVFEFMNNFL